MKNLPPLIALFTFFTIYFHHHALTTRKPTFTRLHLTFQILTGLNLGMLIYYIIQLIKHTPE